MADCMCVVFFVGQTMRQRQTKHNDFFLINRTIQIWYALHIWLLDRISGVSTKFTKMEVTMHRSTIISNTIYSNDFSFVMQIHYRYYFDCDNESKYKSKKKAQAQHSGHNPRAIVNMLYNHSVIPCFWILFLFTCFFWILVVVIEKKIHVNCTSAYKLH